MHVLRGEHDVVHVLTESVIHPWTRPSPREVCQFVYLVFCHAATTQAMRHTALTTTTGRPDTARH